MKRAIASMMSIVVALSLAAVSQGAVVYQSDFTGTTLASAGLESLYSYWAVDDANDRLKWPYGGNTRELVWTTNSWQSDYGFILDVTFNASGNFVRFSMGLVEDTYTPANNNAYWLGSGLANAYGIGFVPAGTLCNAGAVSGIGAGDSLGFNDGTGSGGDVGGSIKLSIDQGDIAAGIDQTLSITVTPSGWSYSLNGAPATTGSMTFDTSKSYRFAAYAQNMANTYISNITIREFAWDGSDDMTWTNPDSTSWSGGTYTNGNDAPFLGDGSGTVTLSGTIEPGSVTVNSASNYTFSGDAIAGSGTLTKDGTGTLTLSATNTYSGGTDILGGTLEFQNNDALGTARIDLGGGGVLQFGVNALNLSEAVRAQNDAGNRIIRLDLAGSNSGTLSGTLDIRRTVAGEFDIDVGTDDTLTVTGTIESQTPGGAGLTKEGDGQLNLSTANSYTGGTTVNGGTVGLQNGGLSSGPLTVNGGYVRVAAHDGFDNLTVTELSGTGGLIAVGRRTFTVNQSTDTTYAGIIQNDNGVNGNSPTALTKSGTGTLTLSGLNTYNGTTTINGGALQVDGALFNEGTRNGITLNNNGSTLRVDGAGYLGPGGSFDKNIVMNNASIFDYNSTADQTLSGIVSGTGDLIKTNTSTLTMTGTNTYTGTTTVDGGGTLQIGGAGRLGDGEYFGSISIANGATFQYSSSASGAVAKYQGVISGDGTLIKDGSSAELRLFANNSIANIEINQGNLRGSTTANSLGDAGTTIFLGDTSGSADAILSYGGTVDFTTKAGITVRAGSSGTKTIFNINGTVTDDTAITLDDSVTINDNSTLTLGGVISGSGGLTKIGTGTLTLTGDSTYTGTTTVNTGTLLVNGTSSGSGDVTVTGTATLGGTGSIGGAVTVNSTGHIAPGTSIGTLTLTNGLTLADGSILDFEINAAGSGDLIDITGGTFTGAPSADGVTVNVTMSGVPAGQVTYTLMDWSGASTVNGVDLSDFNLVYSGSGGGGLEIVGDSLVLTASQNGALFKFR